MTDPSSRDERLRRWLKPAVIVLALVVLGAVAMMLAGGLGHQPRPHGGAATYSVPGQGA